MIDPHDVLDFGGGRCLAIVTERDGLAAVPMVREPDGRWRRARPGEGAAEALVHLLAQIDGSVRLGGFTVRSWTERTAVGERPMGVDQTNESVIVGDTAVVKWATHLQQGPHPAPRRIGVLRDAGFGGMPRPWGEVTWQPPDGPETLAVYVDEYQPAAVDGWTWAVDLITDAVRDHRAEPAVRAAADVGTLVAELHAALSATAAVAAPEDVARWRDAAFETLETACRVAHSASAAILRSRRGEVDTALSDLGALVGTPVIDGHGDLHVGQVLRSAGRFVVTDFDGNPVLPAEQRVLPIPAALDVAGMTQSLAHVAIVARKHTDLHEGALAEIDTLVRRTFLDAYACRLTDLGHADLYDPGPLRALRIQQVLREIVYAANHLPRWMYVPDAALPALLDEGRPGET